MARKYCPKKVLNIGLIILGALINVNLVVSKSFTMDKLTPWQRATVTEIRRHMKDELPQHYMDDDFYFAKWLSSKKFHVDETIDLIRENFKWRKQNHIDSILKEDWSEWEKEFPYQLDSVDKRGQPLLYIRVGSWDVGKMSNMLRLHLLSRYFARIMEEADYKLRRRRASGKDVSQITVLINMDGFGLRKHTCIHCFSLYTSLASTLQAHYPRAAERVVFVNAPTMFTLMFDYLHRVLNLTDQQDMELFGVDRKRWEAVISEFLDRSQFPRDLTDFRSSEQHGNYTTQNILARFMSTHTH